jgi:hypothetical protein
VNCSRFTPLVLPASCPDLENGVTNHDRFAGQRWSGVWQQKWQDKQEKRDHRDDSSILFHDLNLLQVKLTPAAFELY